MTSRILLVGALAFVALTSTAMAGDDEYSKVSLNHVMDNPQAYLKNRFAFEARYDKVGDLYQPFFTMFDEFTFVNFAVWDAEQDLSQQEDYLRIVPLMYVNRREDEMVKDVFALKKYQRFQGVASVQSIFDGRPFIQIHRLFVMDTDKSDRYHMLAAVNRLPKAETPTATPEPVMPPTPRETASIAMEVPRSTPTPTPVQPAPQNFDSNDRSFDSGEQEMEPVMAPTPTPSSPNVTPNNDIPEAPTYGTPMNHGHDAGSSNSTDAQFGSNENSWSSSQPDSDEMDDVHSHSQSSVSPSNDTDTNPNPYGSSRSAVSIEMDVDVEEPTPAPAPATFTPAPTSSPKRTVPKPVIRPPKTNPSNVSAAAPTEWPESSKQYFEEQRRAQAQEKAEMDRTGGQKKR